AAGYLAAMDVWLGLAMLLGIVVMVIVIRVITPTLSARYDDQQSQAAEAAATATDLVHGLRVLQGLGVQSRARATYRRRSRSALRTLDGTLSLGVLIAVVGVARYVMGMLQGLSGAPVWWAGMSTSARRVRDLYTDLGRTVDDPALSLDVLTTRRDERGGTGTGR